MTLLDTLSAELAASTDRLLTTAATLTDADVAAPSALPGWTRGHVLTHLARNADSHLNLLTWARSGVVTPQYPGPTARDAQIAAGASRPAADQLADLRDSAEVLATAIAGQPQESWSAMVGGLRPPQHPAWYILVRRLREVEVHHADLGAVYGWRDWPQVFVDRELHDCVASWDPKRSAVSRISFRGTPSTWEELGTGPAVEGEQRAVLAWLSGRSAGAGVRVVAHEGHDGRPTPEGASLPAPPQWMSNICPPGLPATPPRHYP